MSVPQGDLLRDTTLTPDPDVAGRYHGTISEAWKVMYAFGGVSMTACLRAMQHHLGRPDLDLVTANAIFCSPVPCGPITVDVQVLRDGRGVSQVACDLRVSGSDTVALRTHGVFGTAYPSEHHFVDVQFPTDIAMPDECPPPPPPHPDNPWPEINFHSQTDWRPAIPRFWEQRDTWERGPARFAAWTRLLAEPRLADGSYDPLALAVPADSISPAIGAGLGPSAGHWMTLSLEIGLRFLATPAATPAWVLQDMTAWQCGNGYATGPTHLWDVDGNLLAIAQQTAHLREFPGR